MFAFDGVKLPEASTERIAETRRLARENGREVQVWTPVGIICRPTRREADEYMRYLVDHADRAAIGNVIDILAKDMGARTDPESVARRNGEGLIERRKGKGTFTAGKRVRHPLDRLRSFHESLRLQGLNASMRPLSAGMTATPPDLTDQFGPRCLEVCRLHLVDGEPVALGRSLLPPELAGVDWEAAGQKPVYAILKEVTGKPVVGADIEVKAEAAVAAVAEPLGGSAGMPVLVMIRRSFFADGACADHAVFHVRPERYSFVLSHRWEG